MIYINFDNNILKKLNHFISFTYFFLVATRPRYILIVNIFDKVLIKILSFFENM